MVPYDPDWSAAFERERALLADRLRPWLAAGIHHIGSTAVPGLAAKPVIDMVAGVGDLDDARAAIPVLAALGYEHANHRPHEALWFSKPVGSDWPERTHHLHLTERGSDLWRERLAFRDALRTDPALLREYAELKQRLAVQEQDMARYTAGKRAFVVRVLAGAGVDLA